MRRALVFYHRYYDSIKMGVLVGLLISNGYLLYQQSQTIQRVLDVSRQIEDSNQLTVDYVQCIALIHPDFRTRENIQECVTDGAVPQEIRANTEPVTQERPSDNSDITVPQVPKQDGGRQEPTTSTPPGEPQPNIVERVGMGLTDISDVLDNALGRVL